MSGGRYNYISSNTLEVPWELTKMLEESQEYPELEAAQQKLSRLINHLKKAEREAQDLDKFFHAFEWFKSGDWDIEEAIKESQALVKTRLRGNTCNDPMCSCEYGKHGTYTEEYIP